MLQHLQVDTSEGWRGGSPGERLNSFWRKVIESLYRRLNKKRIKVEVSVTFKEPSRIKANDSGRFAEELVRLAREFEISKSESTSLTSFRPEFPLLCRHVPRLTLKKVNYYSFAWTCTNASAAMVGMNPKRVASLVRTKAKKNYKWANKADKWLLVCASGLSIVAHAGPVPPAATWQDSELQAACMASPFDQVFFWDRVRGWPKKLK